MSDAAEPTVEVVVKLAEHATKGSASQRELLSRAADIGAVLEPVDPSASDPELASYLVARVRRGVAERVAEQLRDSHEVEAAYVKPRDEPPAGRMRHAE